MFHFAPDRRGGTQADGVRRGSIAPSRSRELELGVHGDADEERGEGSSDAQAGEGDGLQGVKSGLSRALTRMVTEGEEAREQFRESQRYFTGRSRREDAGLTVTFEGVRYSVQGRRKTSVILEDVTGILEAGKMTALMGPSGSGKSTLLDVLAGRKTVGRIEGDILYGGERPRGRFLRRHTGYVEQQDTLLPTLTVREMLAYQAFMKRPHSQCAAVKQSAVDLMLDRLGLSHVADTLIGSPLRRGISGGQAKRVNIGIALITEPRVLFLDEPTSGLDSFTADEVMQVVQRLARSGVTICSTIHSPSAFTFCLFDELLMLYGGRVIYTGPAGAAVQDYFFSLPVALPERRPQESDVELVVRVTTGSKRIATKGSRHGAAEQADGSGDFDFVQAYERSPKAEENRRRARWAREHVRGTTVSEVLKNDPRGGSAMTVPRWYAFWVFFRYRTVSAYMSPSWVGTRVFNKLFLAVLAALLFMNEGTGLSQTRVVTQAAVLYMWMVQPSFGAAIYIPTLVIERPLYYRERSDGVYTAGLYLLNKVVEESILSVVVACAATIVFSFSVGLQGHFVIVWMAYFLALSCSTTLAYFIAASTSTLEAANALFPTLITVDLFFAGFLIHQNSIPGFIRWISYLDFMRYAWAAVMADQFRGVTTPVFGTMTPLEFYDITEPVYANMLILASWVVFFGLCAWAALAFVRHQNR